MVVIVHHFWYYQSMKSEPVSGLIPLNDCVLVELKQSHKNFTTKEGKYDSRTEGIVVALAPYKDPQLVNVTMELKVQDLMGKRVHFEEFKEGARIKRDGKIYSFIKLEDIRGWEEA
jgi:co-chaperonin GroES (HSP10)